MISKSVILLGLLALFACQTASANSYPETSIQNRGLIDDLIKQVKGIIESLNGLVSGVIGDALATLNNLVQTIKEIKKKYLDDGIKVITDAINSVVKYIEEQVAKAAELGVDITKCIVGRREQLEKLGTELIENLTNCVTSVADLVLSTVISDLAAINKVVSSITGAPVKLTKCLISLRPIGCVQDLIAELTGILLNAPKMIADIIKNAVKLVQELPEKLATCVLTITTGVTTQTQQIISEIGTCVDDIISGEGSSVALSRASLPELINQVKEIIQSLAGLVTGTIGDALKLLGNITNIVATIKEKFLDEGLAVIGDIIGDVTGYIKNVTKHAAELGIDITKCVVGEVAALEKLSETLVANLTNCVTGMVGNVLTMIAQDIKVINKMVADITAAPIKLTKCLISLRPIKCVTDLLADLTNLLITIPGRIAEIVGNANTLIENLPKNLAKCIESVANFGREATTGMISRIGECVDDLISGSTNAPTNGPTNGPTNAPTDAPTTVVF